MKPRLLATLIGVALATAACNPGSYPVDIFPEMHYAPAQGRLQPNRLSAPRDAVPVTGGRAELRYSQARTVQKPLPASAGTLREGTQLYDVNCAMCHGQDAHGDGPVAKYFQQQGTDVTPVAPPDFRSDLVRGYSDGQLYWVVTYGVGNMPAFQQLLTDQQVWAVVSYIKEVQTRP